MIKRTWLNALGTLTATKKSINRDRWLRIGKDKAIGLLFPLILVETKAEALLKTLQVGTVSTNTSCDDCTICVDMGWLPRSVMPKRQRPTVCHGER